MIRFLITWAMLTAVIYFGQWLGRGEARDEAQAKCAERLELLMGGK